MKFLVCIVSEHSLKATSLVFETETVGPCLVAKFKWEVWAQGPPGRLSGYAPCIYPNISHHKEKAISQENLVS